MKKELFSKNQSSAFVMVIVLIAMMVMTFFLLTGTVTTTTSIKVSGNYNKSVDAFNIAEAGIARARPLLENQAFDTVLTTYQTTPVINTTSFNGGTYKVTVSNDEKDLASGGTATHDTNSIIKVVSQGISAAGAQSKITTYIQIVGGSNPVKFPAPPAAGESGALVCGSAVNFTSQDPTGGVIGETSVNPPCDMGVTPCGGPPVAANTYDMVSENALASCVGCGPVSRTVAGASANCSQWRTLANQLAALNGSNPNVVILTGSSVNRVVSTCAAPKVIIISTTSSTFTINSAARMCGTIVVASDTTISTEDHSETVGLMLFLGGNSGTKSIKFLSNGGGELIGKLIFASSAETNTKTIDLAGATNIQYSGPGLGYANAAINMVNGGGGAAGTGQLMTVGWEESY